MAVAKLRTSASALALHALAARGRSGKLAPVKFARWTFLLAGIYGVLGLVPQYFMEQRIGRDFPPPVTHPEHFYGFIGVALAWQIAFFIISRDPVRYRPIMPVAMLEKVAFGGAAVVLFMQQRIAAPVLAAGVFDLVLASLFAIAMQKTAKPN
jgi:hypothetical protein